mgnify:CR=1 FL=1
MSAVVTSATSGGTFANDATVGTIDWDTPSNASASDDTKASATLLLSEVSKYLKATNFGFNIPTGSTIRGIVVEVERSSALATTAEDNSISLVKGGTIEGDNKAAAGAWPTSDTYATYGSATDLWGLTWSAEDINLSTFGVAVAADATAAATARIDHIRITVHYSDLQMDYFCNINFPPSFHRSAANGKMSFFPMNLGASIYWRTANLAFSATSANQTHTISMGLYSLSGNTLTLNNYFSGTFSKSNSGRFYQSMTDVSATSNLTPGTWFLGLFLLTGGASNISLRGAYSLDPQNAFPGAFIGGAMTVSTGALPNSYNTSDLDITGLDAISNPIIIISS